MTFLKSLPDNAVRRLTKVIVRSIHLVGVAGFFGYAMMGHYETTFVVLTIVSGIVLTFMEAYSGWIWFVQLRGIALYLKLLLLLVIHIEPASSLPCLIAIIVLSGFISHAPSWIRYFSVQHWQVVHSKEDILG
jgi:hypothetical protein